MQAINNKIWLLAEKLYIHCYKPEGFNILLQECGVDAPAEIYNDFEIYSFMTSDNHDFLGFIQQVPNYRYLSILEKIFFEPRVISTQHDNWNYYGIYIKNWYPELRQSLEDNGILIDYTNNKLHFPEESETQAVGEEDFLAYNFGDPFLDHIRKEVNECYKGGQYLAVIFLTRKITEALIVRIFEVCFPKIVRGVYQQDNHILWYDTAHNRHLDFDKLIDNLVSRSSDFREDKDLIEKICNEVRSLKNQANKMVHRDYEIPTLESTNRLGMQTKVNLLRKAFRKYCNP